MDLRKSQKNEKIRHKNTIQIEITLLGKTAVRSESSLGARSSPNATQSLALYPEHKLLYQKQQQFLRFEMLVLSVLVEMLFKWVQVTSDFKSHSKIWFKQLQ